MSLHQSKRSLLIAVSITIIVCYAVFTKLEEHIAFSSSRNYDDISDFLYSLKESQNITLPENSGSIINPNKVLSDTEYSKALYNFLKDITKLRNVELLKMLTVTIQKKFQTPAVVIPKEMWVGYNATWKGYQLPLLTAMPLGRVGNVMGQYSTLMALGKIFNCTVALHPGMNQQLREYFPHLNMPVLEHVSDINNFKQLRYSGSMYNYLPLQLAAAGLLGPQTFLLKEYPFEMGLYNLERDEIRKRLTFNNRLQNLAQKILHTTASQHRKSHGLSADTEITFVGFHIRRTDYAKHMKSFGGTLPGPKYFNRTLQYYRNKIKSALLFVASSDDKEFIKTSFAEEKDTYVTPDNLGRMEDMATLASCNHSIFTLGSFGFWSSFLAGGEVVYAEESTQKEYRFTTPFYKAAGLSFFTPFAIE